jgi:hypothetical protein
MQRIRPARVRQGVRMGRLSPGQIRPHLVVLDGTTAAGNLKHLDTFNAEGCITGALVATGKT